MNELILRINLLPNELVNIIKEYIHKKIMVFIDKTNYTLYHFSIKKYIPCYENYIRNMIRRDYAFVFEQIVRENYKKWMEIKHYIYENFVFKNYIYFILHFCIENDSQKCRSFIKNFLKELGLCKNQHKKNVVKYIKWKN
jgi:hypothetical protein